MKLLGYGPNGHEVIESIVDNGHIHDLSGRCAISPKKYFFLIAGSVARTAPECPCWPLVSNQEIPASGSASTEVRQ
jgi:hypothetical protein